MTKRCKKCVQLDTRINIEFDDEDVCSYCRSVDDMKNINWNIRFKQLEKICDQHRGKNPYDMVIPVSGGKDSTYQVGFFKEKMNMNPLCVMINNSSWTKTGEMNFYNLSRRFDVNIVQFTPAMKTMIEKTKQGFFESLWPEKYWDSILYEKPLEIAQKFGIQFVAWGEDTMYRDISNALSLLPVHKRERYTTIDAIFLSYYLPWSRYDNVKYAKANGFKGLDDTKEWDRLGLQGFDYEQVDTVGYLCNQYFKFIKFGFSNQTELCSDAIRHGKMTREEALARVEAFDWQLDPKMLQDFCQGIDITTKQFWETIDKFANRDLLEFTDHWKLKKEFL